MSWQDQFLSYGDVLYLRKFTGAVVKGGMLRGSYGFLLSQEWWDFSMGGISVWVGFSMGGI